MSGQVIFFHSGNSQRYLRPRASITLRVHEKSGMGKSGWTVDLVFHAMIPS
jgi:hypothetical protein